MADRTRARVDRVGDAALLVTLADELDLEVNALAHRVAARLRDGGRATVPGHAGVLVPFDPDTEEEPVVRAAIDAALEAATRDEAKPWTAGTLHELRVAYGGADGPDLADVASRTGLAERDVVRLHAAETYRVLVLGFAPGFPYLGLVPAALELPRRVTPRVRVPAGSVAIAGRQTGVYPFESPGGWHVIGRTDAALWDSLREPTALLAPGDRVRFVPA